MRAATHVMSSVHRITPARPTHGCQPGTPPGMDCRNNITMGVNGGKNEIAVAKAPLGCCIKGTIINAGIIMGRIKKAAKL